MEYIEKELLIKRLTHADSLGLIMQIEDVNSIMDNIPSADVRPVVRGEWVGYTMSAFHGCDDFGEPIYRDVSVYYCSKCNRRTVIKENFCPNCGADMRGE